jgi:hypothetical protein
MLSKKCQKCGDKTVELVMINVGKNIFCYWCNNCVFLEMEKQKIWLMNNYF